MLLEKKKKQFICDGHGRIMPMLIEGGHEICKIQGSGSSYNLLLIVFIITMK